MTATPSGRGRAAELSGGHERPDETGENIGLKQQGFNQSEPVSTR